MRRMDANDRMIAVPATVLADLLDLAERALSEMATNDQLCRALKGSIEATRLATRNLAPA